uniref:Uncharacterized protein n=1 Tax=Anguilla anguilla TaxID=7936 RepID=A0A0E9QWW9_ANGAN
MSLKKKKSRLASEIFIADRRPTERNENEKNILNFLESKW